MLGAAEAQLAVEEINLGAEVVDQRQARFDGAAPRLGDREAVKQLAARDAEQVSDRAPVASWVGAGLVLARAWLVTRVRRDAAKAPYGVTRSGSRR